ncbi:MAG: hypothetical protein AAF630_21255, partial [Cyanobacteria bacterium P01_C01_bin.38]
QPKSDLKWGFPSIISIQTEPTVANPPFEYDFQGNKAYSIGFVTVVTPIGICLTFIIFLVRRNMRTVIRFALLVGNIYQYLVY